MKLKNKKILFIINPASGQDYPILAVANRALQEIGCEWDILITRPEMSIKKQLASYKLDEIDIVCSYGGDDTVHHVARSLIDTETPIFPLHGGTANLIAHDLQIPEDPAEALKLLVNGKVKEAMVDSALANDNFFIIAALIGPASEVNRTTERDHKNTLGVIAYIQNSLDKMPTMKPQKFKIAIDDQKHIRTGLGVLVLNSQVSGFGNLKMHTKAGLQTGKVVVTLIPEINLATIASGVTHLALNSFLDEFSESWITDHATITTDLETGIMADDHVFKGKKLEVSVKPMSVKLLVPADE